MSANRITSRTALVVVILALLLAVGSTVPAGAVAQRATPTFYQAQNCTLINGWDWLRTTAPVPANAVWRFNVAPSALIGVDPSSVYLLVEAAVTQTTSGGSGYARPLRLSLRSGAGEWVKVRVEMQNPFRPEDPDDSSGLGYATQGFIQINDQNLIRDFLATGDLRVRYVWTPGYHVAVKADSVRLAFSH